MTAVMNLTGVAKAYDRWAPIHDIVFGPVFRRGRTAVVVAAERVSGRIFEVGVGTGLSLSSYSAASRVVGIDIPQPMLVKVRGTVERWLMPLTSRMGWRTEFAWARYADWLA